MRLYSRSIRGIQGINLSRLEHQGKQTREIVLSQTTRSSRTRPYPELVPLHCHTTGVLVKTSMRLRQNMDHHRCHCSVSAPSSNPLDGPITCMSICLVYLSFLRWSNSVQPPSCSHKSRIDLLAAHQSASKDVRWKNTTLTNPYSAV